ncbi:creatininase family protein [Nocardioides sp. L-11A]|uniref:creatininase family protein n=1 Tax=Nocardioides sp. L-11A TaxID=3043848 RepID=UPI00249A2B70|nr:creatininase family protein [Nocardioides sp. L-11A]
MSGHVLGELTTEDVAAADFRLAIVPVGAVEQHGPHLAVLTDARIAERFAGLLAERLDGTALLCPLLPYGLSEHHAAFAGTVTLRPATFISLVGDIIDSLAAQGFDKVVLVNGHGGNMEALSLVARDQRARNGVRVGSLMWARLAHDVCAEGTAGSAYGHACENETSLAMVLAPELLRPDRVRAPVGARIDVLHAMPPRALVDTAYSFDELTPDGVWGDPRSASTERGERILATALERAEEYCRALAKEPPARR